MAVSASKTKLIKDRRTAGLCLQCGKDASGKSRCSECSSKAHESRKRSQDKKKAAGVCQNSGCNAEAMPGRTVCSVCSQQASKASSNRYARNKAAGVCRYCGDESEGKARCEDCAAAFTEYSQAWYEERKSSGCCLNCASKLKSKDTSLLCKKCRELKNTRSKERWLRLKSDAFAAYGGPVCVGCGETEIAILEIDHTSGGGNKHRKLIGQSNTYLWLKQNNYPQGFRVLCPTCNKKAHMGLLPIR